MSDPHQEVRLQITITEAQRAIIQHYGDAMGLSLEESAQHLLISAALDWYPVMKRELSATKEGE